MGVRGYYYSDGSSLKIKHGELFESLQQPRRYHENQMIYQQGDTAEYIYYLKSGKVKYT